MRGIRQPGGNGTAVLRKRARDRRITRGVAASHLERDVGTSGRRRWKLRNGENDERRKTQSTKSISRKKKGGKEKEQRKEGRGRRSMGGKNRTTMLEVVRDIGLPASPGRVL